MLFPLLYLEDHFIQNFLLYFLQFYAVLLYASTTTGYLFSQSLINGHLFSFWY